MKHSKTEVFHFSRPHGAFNPPPLDLTPLSRSILLPKPTWRYLGFIFDCKLSFWSHINFYVNKAISTIKCMKILGNSSRGLIFLQKRWLYKCCALPIVLYNFQLWYYNKASLYYPLNILRKMQWRTAIWITGAFHMLPIAGIKAISGLFPIHLHLKKLYNRFLLRGFSLPSNHIIKSIINSDGPHNQAKHCLSINSLTPKQVLCLRSSLIDIDNRYNEFLLSFTLLDKEFSPGNCLYDNFPDCFSFYPQLHNISGQLCKLNNITITLLFKHLQILQLALSFLIWA